MSVRCDRSYFYQIYMSRTYAIPLRDSVLFYKTEKKNPSRYFQAVWLAVDRIKDSFLSTIQYSSVCWTYPHSLCCGNIPEVCAFGKLLAFVLDNTRNLQRQHRNVRSRSKIGFDNFPGFPKDPLNHPLQFYLLTSCGEFSILFCCK